MESRVKLLGHPVHPMLVVFPVGLFATSVLFDILYKMTREPDLSIASFYMIAAGLIGGVLAAVFGAIDWLRRKDNLNLVPEDATLILSVVGLALLLLTAWLGGELVYRLGVGVDRGANVDAPNSLTEPARSTSPIERT